MQRTTAMAITAATLGVLLFAPAANAGFFGLNYSFPKLSSGDAAKLRKSGAKTVRWTLSWQRVETREGNVDWSESDKLVGALAARGIRVLPTVLGSPKWAAPSSITPPLGSRHARTAWKGFLRAAVNRYGHGGSYWKGPYRQDHRGKRALPIKTWQIWNEPNLQSAMNPPKPATYAKLLKLSHGAIRDADSHAKVMFGGMPGYSNNVDAWDFLKRAYGKKGTAHAFDVAALHPYARTVHQMVSEVKRFRHVMRTHGDRHKPLWITEIGWGSLPKKSTPYGQTKGKKGQARMLRRSFHALKNKRHRWHIKRVLWFNFRDPAGGSVHHCSFCSSAGLLEHSSRPKPSWKAFKGFTH
jgi:Glycosyl hydrolase catalytic core